MNLSKLLNVLLVIVLCLYVVAGVYTALPLILDKIPTLIFEDFLIYQKAVELTFRGANPFRTTGGDTNFFYPPPSLLVVEVFSHIKPFLLKVATYTTVNILLLALMVRGVAKKYDYGIRDTWYWYVLCLGFAPFLELLTIGQINVLTMFGIFVLFFWENRSPIIAGLGLALAIITKVTPVLLFGYLLFNQKYRVLLITVMWVLILIGATALRYGFSPLIRYPAAFQDLTDTFVLDKNSQSLVAKLVTIASSGQTSPISSYIIDNYQVIQTVLMGYLFIIICVSILIAFLGKQPKEPVFITTVLAMMLSPNV
ncbi:MAG TPA: glycosyltransferase family 87 protein, partial [Anaerolineaceae bacterium]|nr:glycosyltransferase family 87 protein [Anaerolineaceae bacterium]